MIATTQLFNSPISFDNVKSPGWALLWIGLAVTGALILYFTYRGIFQRSERNLAWGLMWLRGLGLLALLLALARPSWTDENVLVDHGRVVVVVDNSLSMSLADTSGKARYALAVEAVQRLKKNWESSKGGGPLEVAFFDINGAPIEGNLPDQPTIDQTDLIRAVRESTARLRSRNLTGVVLISDGMDTTRRDQNVGERDFPELAGQGVPIHTIGFRADAEAGGLDLAVRKPKAPERAMINNEIKVEIPVAKTSGPAIEATVSIKRGRDLIVAEKVNFPEANDEKMVVLKVTPREAGSFVYTASVEGPTGETVLANNFAHFPLRVDKEKIQVVYIEGFLRYEYKFLKKHLEDDPDIKLTSEVRLVNPDRPTQPTLRLTPELLKNKHVVILGDMEASYLSNPEYQALIRWLEEKGPHALLVLGGYHTFGPDGFRNTPLAEALPVVFAQAEPYQSEEAFKLELTPEGRRNPVFEMTSDRVRDEDSWSKAPALLGCGLVLRAKPVAEVLAVNFNPNLMMDGKKAVVLATQPFGQGRTMVLTADTTWRWSRFMRIQGQPDTLYARFWSQTMRWLSGRGMDDQRPLMTVNTEKPDYEIRKPVTVQLERQPRPDNPLNTTTVAVEVAGPVGQAGNTSKSFQVEMRAGSTNPHLFKGTFYPSEGGRFEVNATLKDEAGTPLANQASEFLVHGSNLELANRGTNPDILAAIALQTGGQYFNIEEADQVADKIPRKEKQLRSVQRSEFWFNPALSLVFLVAVSAEWFIRRRNHLV